MARTRTIDSEPSPAEKEAITALYRRLTGRRDAVVSFPPFSNGTLIAADEDGVLIGMATMAFYDAPSGRKAWLEDFVVDGASAGKGVGRLLLDAVVSHARRIGAVSLNLTSAPSREAAHALYRSYGMQMRETDVFKLPLL